MNPGALSAITNPRDLANKIDHTLLLPEATRLDHRRLITEALEHRFFSVCVASGWVSEVAAELKGSSVKLTSVVGFPLGSMDPLTKAFEAEQARRDGADEIDMVMNIGFLKSGDLGKVREDIEGVVRASMGGLVKVIIETGLLTDSEKRLAAQISVDAGAHFVKTCTGFSRGQATVEDVELIRSVVGTRAQIKASGGIKDFESALRLVAAGADRLGTSRGVSLVTGSPTNPSAGY